MAIATLLFLMAAVVFYFFSAWLQLMGLRTRMFEYMDASDVSDRLALFSLVTSALCALVWMLGE